MKKERNNQNQVFYTIIIIAVTVCAASLFTISCHNKPKRNPVILISIDTLRPDHLGTYGYNRATSPNIDRLAGESTVFENAYSHSPNTIISHATMLTSLHPIVHGVTPEYKMANSLQTLAEYYKTAGYTTGGFTTHNDWLCKEMGFAQGFEVFYSRYVNARAVNKEVFKFLDKHSDDEFFLFIHYYDVHSDFADLPYRTCTNMDQTFCKDYQGGFTGCQDGLCASELLKRFNDTGAPLPKQDLQYIIDLYDGGILYTDNYIGQFMNKLKELEIYDKTMIVLTADHGEEFREHGHFLHDQLYEETMHVPLIVKFPGAPIKRRVPQLAGVIDIMPTLLDFSAIPYNDLQGLSLLPVVNGDQSQDHPVFSTLKETGTDQADNISVRNHSYCYFTWDRFKNSFLFNRETDIHETIDLAARETEITSQMQRFAKEYFLTNCNIRNRLKHKRAKIQQNDETTKLLKSLGYLN